MATESLLLDGHTAGVYSLAFHPAGTLLASGDYHGTIHLWDCRTGTLVASLIGQQLDHADYTSIACLAFQPDGGFLAAGLSAEDDTLRLWDVPTRTEAVIIPGAEITSLTFSSDGTLLACGSSDVLLRDGRTGELLALLDGHGDYVLCLAFSPDGALLATGTAYDEGAVRVWDVATRTVQAVFGAHGGNMEHLLFTADGSSVFSIGWDALHLWDVKSGRELAVWAQWYGGRSISLSPDRSMVAFETEEGVRFKSAKLLPDGTVRRFRGPGYRSTVHLVELATGRELASLHGHIENVTSMAFSQNRELLATADSEGHIRLWDLRPYLPT